MGRKLKRILTNKTDDTNWIKLIEYSAHNGNELQSGTSLYQLGN